MKVRTKCKIIYGTSAVFMLIAIFGWWRYTERTVWGFLGLFLVGMIFGKLLGWVITLPFKDEEPEADENYYEQLVRAMNAKVSLQIAESELAQAKAKYEAEMKTI